MQEQCTISGPGDRTENFDGLGVVAGIGWKSNTRVDVKEKMQ